MSALIDEIIREGKKMQTERPRDLDTLRKRLGARHQNASIEIYAYIDLRSSMDILYQLEKDILNEETDLKTVIKIVIDWLNFAGGRAPICFQLNDFSRYALGVIEELRAAKSRKEAADILRPFQHYTCQLAHWVDLDFAWHEVGVAYAAAKGDPVPDPV
jgi:hypothetical protein